MSYDIHPAGPSTTFDGYGADDPDDVLVPETPETTPDEIREIARAAFAGRPPMADGVFALPTDRNPWRALDDALGAVLPAHEAMVRRHFADVIETRFGPVDPETGQVYDKTALEVVRWLRGEQP